MKRALGAAAVLALALLAVGSLSTPVAAREGTPGLTVATAKTQYAVGEPVSLTFTVTNVGSAPCQLAAFPDGTITMTRFTRDGAPVSPMLTPVRYSEGFDGAIRSQLRILAPGEQVSFAALNLDASIETVSPMPSGGSAISARWPVAASGRS